MRRVTLDLSAIFGSQIRVFALADFEDVFVFDLMELIVVLREELLPVTVAFIVLWI